MCINDHLYIKMQCGPLYTILRCRHVYCTKRRNTHTKYHNLVKRIKNIKKYFEKTLDLLECKF